MASPAAPPPPHKPPAEPRPAAPPPGLVLARWTYVDEQRRHQVHAGVRPGDRPAFVVRESAFQNEHADEVIERALPLDAPWEAQLYHWQLECRLSVLGRYWRHDALHPGWRGLAPPQGRPDLDLREVGVSPYRGRAVFYHFHLKAQRRDKLLVAIPNATPSGKRYLLALATFEFPDSDEGDVELLHAHLPEMPARSVVVREHAALKAESYGKLVGAQDFRNAHGADWAREAGAAYAGVLRRVSENAFGSPKRDRAVHIDPLYTDFVKALTDPRLLDLQARFLTPEEQERALEGGESMIKRLISQKRETASHEEQHKLTVVQASLLARDQLRPGQRARVDPEVSALVRRFAYYL